MTYGPLGITATLAPGPYSASEAETADTLGVPVGTVKSRVSRALARLATELDGSGIDGTREERTG